MPESDDLDDFDGPADQCGSVGDPRDVRTPICVLKPGHSGPHRQMVIGTEEIGGEGDLARVTRQRNEAYEALEASRSVSIEDRAAALARLVEKGLLTLEQALGLSELVRERNTFLQRLLTLKAEAKAVVETDSSDLDVIQILQGRIRVRELLRPGPEDSAEVEVSEKIPTQAEEILKAEKAVIDAVLAEDAARDELAAASGAGTQISTALYHMSKAKLARLVSVRELRELRDGYR